MTDDKYRQLIVERFDNLLSVAKSILIAAKGNPKRRSSARRCSRSDFHDATIAKNRARVVAALRKLHDRVGLSVSKAVRRLRVNPTWSARMKGVSDRSWASYYYEK